MAKFIYVFNKEARDTLLAENYQLLKNDEYNSIYVFKNEPEQRFDLSNISLIFSDTLTF